MFGRPPSNEEKEAKRNIPTVESIFTLLREIGVTENTTTTKALNEGGSLSYMEIRVSEPDDDGCTVEYQYSRYLDWREPVIHVVYFDKDGDPLGGKSVAKYRNGAWVLTP